MWLIQILYAKATYLYIVGGNAVYLQGGDLHELQHPANPLVPGGCLFRRAPHTFVYIFVYSMYTFMCSVYLSMVCKMLLCMSEIYCPYIV